MKQFLVAILIDGALLTAAWFGFVEGVLGAQYVLQFVIWAVALPAAFVLLLPSFQATLCVSEKPAPLALKIQRRIVAGAVLGVLVWHGAIATAVAWMFWMLAGAVCRAGVKAQREALADS